MKKYIYICVLFLLFLVYGCTDEQPVVIEERLVGSVVGRIKPAGINAKVSLVQGAVVDSTTADSLTGAFSIDDVQVGFYTLRVTANGYGVHVTEMVEIVANGVTSIGEVLMKTTPNQIRSFSPANNSKDIGLKQSGVIDFNILMDHSSVENAFSISPSTPMLFTWEEDGEGSRMTFSPDGQYRAYTTYSMTLGTNAMSIYRDSLSIALNAVFTTEPVKIVSFTPENGATYVDPASSLYMRFNTAMNSSSVENAFSTVPEARGQFKWHNELSCTFIPSNDLATSTAYLVTISRGARDHHDSHIESTYNASFTTEPLLVVDSYPKDGATDLSRNTTIMITFNAAVDQRAAEQAFSITPAKNGVFAWSDKKKFSYKPDEELAMNAFYFVALDSTCVDEYGEHLAEPFTVIFKTGSL
ncbi:MAG: Ig-like domain-containing protein [candidate division KSB1 bacterium]|jgi:hypothetical protein|nr:Ig-like domain-containing protein [candidate division KSB1 bacterium]